jgi:2-methylcitrate dehydratase PrpD
MNLSRVLAEYVKSLQYKDLDSDVISEAKVFITDCVGCMLAGVNEEPTSLVIEHANKFGGVPTVSVLGKKDMTTDVYNAAIINGVAAHVHDYDDQLPSMNGHPSVAVLPAVIAVAERIGASGKDTLLAYIAGVEVCHLMSLAFNRDDRYYSKGWHTTSTFGVFAAALAVCKLLDLSEEQMVNAIGIAASESSGLKGNFGTMTKPLHAGRAAAKGIYCAEMAKIGYKSNPDIMEVSEGFGYVNGLTPDTDDVIGFIRQGKSAFLSPGINMKAWPCCKQNHSAINSILILKEKYGFRPEDVEAIHCNVQPVIYDCLKYTEPVTSLQGKFSLNYNIALSVINGTVKLEDFDKEEITDPRIKDFMKKVHMTVDMELSEGKYNNGKFDSIVKVHLKDGRILEEHTVNVKGDYLNKMNDKEIYDKFYDCAKRALNPEGIDKVKSALNNIEDMANIKDLITTINESAIEH